jgi:hypothetical protein
VEWRFHNVREVSEPLAAYAASQTDATGWFTLAAMRSLRLHPAFRQSVEDHAPHDG